ncbi:hypothetical protein NOS3756_45380 [Nostoc sp. NIES-3756]|uniref:GumC family protein n=1 Tax=Nostoc sp. NIES-3756 TaxID=1751286 RepID=UPI000722148D|nr:polysaccharide biosynthesis tyrosine autokinase [Nostoc sp. NIES-3756]BAT55550.1 hypothetical protein NOS3756_45380 [Nostoc sp. NIES-3756]
MDNQHYKISNVEQNGKPATPLPSKQPDTWNEESDKSWNYQDFLSLLQRRVVVILGVTTTVMIAMVTNVVLNPKQPEYESKFQMLVEPVNDSTKIADLTKEDNKTQSTLDYDSQILVLKSPKLLNASVKKLQTAYPYFNYGFLINSLKINRLGETKIIEVSYRGTNPNLTKAVLDEIAQIYLNYSQEARQAKLSQGIAFINQQLPSLQNRVNQIQKELQDFREKYSFNDPDSGTALIVNKSTELYNKQQEINLQIKQLQDYLSLLKDKKYQDIVLTNAPLYQQLMAQLQQLDVQIAASSTVLQDTNPRIQTLKEQRESLLPLLRQEADNFIKSRTEETFRQINNLSAQKQELAKRQVSLEQERKNLPNLAQRYIVIQNQLQLATESLNRFLSTREVLQIQISQTEQSWQLIQAPYTPEYPIVTADLKGNIIQILGISIVLGLGAAFLLEKLDNTYHNARSLKEKIKLPLLGVIPFQKEFQNVQAHASILDAHDVAQLNTLTDLKYSKDSQEFLEALRVLYTNIQLLNSERQINSITITSAMSNDGKSTIAFHLALIAATMGQKVLLVDADLRKPKIHTLANLQNKWGLSNLVVTNLRNTEVIQQLPSMSKLSVITAGYIPPDPTKVLSSEKMKQLMIELHNNFDLVIYDTPPLVGLADTSLIAPYTEGILMVVKIDQTQSSMLEKALDDVKISSINVLGLVANGEKNYLGTYYKNSNY